ncbi:helix-turn-helix domain-containing protein [Vibrio sp. HN007]|uniref:helix-turn-helix domain-containing protein n=1 Tax=Vibrio iocasae TaxID=3098914 RepID=UPI0035D4E416
MKKYHFSSLTEHHEALGFPKPEHPLLSVVHISSKDKGGVLACKKDDDIVVSTDFYSISIKRIISGEVFYGRTKYDCNNGTMIFTAPQQELRTKGIKVQSEGRLIMFHEDYVRGHPIQEQIKKYHFFSYAINEALHLSPKEEKQITDLFDAIETEYHNNQDEFTKELILDLVTTLLRYSNRYYHRQFLMRKESQNSLFERFRKELEDSLNVKPGTDPVIPSVEELANSLHVTARYLSDALKVETGKTAKDWIHLELIDSAKDLLLSSNVSVSEVAYRLGFEYPNYFARLFKKKVGLTPSQYRNQIH